MLWFIGREGDILSVWLIDSTYRYMLMVHWIEGDILSVNTAASNGENLPREYSSKQFGLSIQSIGTC